MWDTMSSTLRMSREYADWNSCFSFRSLHVIINEYEKSFQSLEFGLDGASSPRLSMQRPKKSFVYEENRASKFQYCALKVLSQSASKLFGIYNLN